MNRRKFLTTSLAASGAYVLSAQSLAAQAKGQAGPPALEALPSELREKLRNDPFRPQFHLLPRANWMNDPCAPRFHRGAYHMFFQYNPYAAIWGDMHWNHATSPDMIHWQHRPLALAPTAGSYDAAGCFTGSVLPGMDVPTILYTGVTRAAPETIRGEGLHEVQCLATSTDPDLLVWKKQDKPVIAAPPPGLSISGFRDPCPWKDGNLWYLIVGSGINKVGGMVLLYRSHDGHNWEYLHPLAQGVWNGNAKTNPVASGEMWECPDFFPLGEKHVLLYSTESKVYWEVGVFDRHELKFHSETRGLLDHGHYYAMKSMADAQGRRVLWGWVQETRTPDQCLAAGWSGSMALPRVLAVGNDNRLRMEWLPELNSLCKQTKTILGQQDGQAIDGKVAKLVIQNRAGSVNFKFKPQGKPCTLALRAGDSSILSIAYNGDAQKPALSIGPTMLPLTPGLDEVSSVDLWIDGSVIEVLADSSEALTLRDFTDAAEEIHLTWNGDAAAFVSLSVSEVTPISADRLTS